MLIFIIPGCIFIIDEQRPSFIIVSWGILWHAIIACMSDSDIFIFAIMEVQPVSVIIASWDMDMQEPIIVVSAADIFMLAWAGGA